MATTSTLLTVALAASIEVNDTVPTTFPEVPRRTPFSTKLTMLLSSVRKMEPDTADQKPMGSPGTVMLPKSTKLYRPAPRLGACGCKFDSSEHQRERTGSCVCKDKGKTHGAWGGDLERV